MVQKKRIRKKKKDAGQGRRPNNGLSTRQKISGILLGTTFGIVLLLDYSLPALLSSLFEALFFSGLCNDPVSSPQPKLLYIIMENIGGGMAALLESSVALIWLGHRLE